MNLDKNLKDKTLFKYLLIKYNVILQYNVFVSKLYKYIKMCSYLMAQDTRH